MSRHIPVSNKKLREEYTTRRQYGTGSYPRGSSKCRLSSTVTDHLESSQDCDHIRRSEIKGEGQRIT